MTEAKRPISVTLLAAVYILTGIGGLIVHGREILALRPETPLVVSVELIAVLAGIFMLRGHNWARWLALAWIAFHVAISFPSMQKIIGHSLFLALFAWILLRPAATRYFRSPLRSMPPET
jgi:hypothetical protein